MPRRPLSLLLLFVSAGLIGTLAREATAQDIQIRYRKPADAFEILDNVSNW